MSDLGNVLVDSLKAHGWNPNDVVRNAALDSFIAAHTVLTALMPPEVYILFTAVNLGCGRASEDEIRSAFPLADDDRIQTILASSDSCAGAHAYRVPDQDSGTVVNFPEKVGESDG